MPTAQRRLELRARRGRPRGRLDREAWLVAARGVLARSGVGAVTVHGLARELGVTKGSFYWHFEDLDELLETLLEQWLANEAMRVIDRVEARGVEPVSRLLLLEETLQAEAPGACEAALRAWGLFDGRAARALRSADRERLAWLRGVFREAGFPPAEAEMRSQLFYAHCLWAYAGTASLPAAPLAHLARRHALLGRR